ncbi:MAG: hypothetical protein RMN25_09890 [Anaerolineae bacterium]|nr:hypothetical protein [Thermoflexales bacterium]MDW8408079.1 hypothetical protein [Anaerolineae bacterium]
MQRTFTNLRVLLLVFSASDKRWPATDCDRWDQRMDKHRPEGGYINALAIDPQTPTTLYAGTYGGGVFN